MQVQLLSKYKETKSDFFVNLVFSGSKNEKNTLLKTLNFTGEKDSNRVFYCSNSNIFNFYLGLGDRKKLKEDHLREASAKAFKEASKNKVSTLILDTEKFSFTKNEFKALVDGLLLAEYQYSKFKKNPKSSIKKAIFIAPTNKDHKEAIHESKIICEGVNFTRDLVNDPPNLLHSEAFAKVVESDVKKNLPGVKVKILKKDALKKMGMNLFLGVNRGSNYDPRLVQLTYEPKVQKKTKHIAFVGKGLTFDSGGYSLKVGGSMMGMKFDMAGAATVYGAFRNLVKLQPKVKLTCILGITDNMVNEEAITPDMILKAMNGKTVEVLNTDAEGRLVLADCLSYTSGLKPDLIIDAATLTGACVRALGHVCGVMGNKKSLQEKYIEAGEIEGERAWSLPMYPEYAQDMKSKVADLKNIGGSGNAGSQKAAHFLENFVSDGIDWMHLDIAGVADHKNEKAYYPQTSASGHSVRTLTRFICENF